MDSAPGFNRAGDTPAALVLYPDEGHGFLGEGQPAYRRDAAGRIVVWLQWHVVPPKAAADGPRPAAQARHDPTPA